jgi:hypothetical protein
LNPDLLSTFKATKKSPDKGVTISCPIGNYSGIKQLATARAFPGIERADKVIKFFSEHTAFAAWTVHGIPRQSFFINETTGYYTLCANVYNHP